MNRELIPFRAEHLVGLQIQAGQADETLGRDIASDLRWLEAQNYPSFTGVEGSRVIGASGVIPSGIGVGDGWMFLRACPMSGDLRWVTRQTRKFLDTVRQDHRFMMVAITVRRTWPAAHRFARALGFAMTDDMVSPHGSEHYYNVYERH